MATTSSRAGRSLFWAKAALVVLAAFLGVLGVNACGETDTVVFVRVFGSTTGTISQFAVNITVAGQERSFLVPGAKSQITLPTSFSIQIPPTFEGVAMLRVNALNDQDVVIGQGMKTSPALGVGTENVLDVELFATLIPPGGGMTTLNKDGGVDGLGASDAAVDGLPSDVAPRDSLASPDAEAPDASLPDPLDAPSPIPDAAIDASDDVSVI